MTTDPAYVAYLETELSRARYQLNQQTQVGGVAATGGDLNVAAYMGVRVDELPKAARRIIRLGVRATATEQDRENLELVDALLDARAEPKMREQHLAKLKALNAAVRRLRAYCNEQIRWINRRAELTTSVSFARYNELLRECDAVFKVQSGAAQSEGVKS